MTPTPDYARLSRHLGALAYHILQTGAADSQDAQTCLEVAEALRTLLERNKELERERDEARRQSDRFCDKYLAALSRAEAAEAERDALAAENERLKEDRARFPDRPDDIGRMIEAHIGNLKAGKKSAEDLADKAFDRAFRAEAALAAKDAELARRDMQLEASAKVALDLSAQLAETRKALDALDRMSRGVDWCDQDEQARRWSAARRALEGGE